MEAFFRLLPLIYYTCIECKVLNKSFVWMFKCINDMSGHYRPSIIQWILLRAEQNDLFALQNENKEFKQPQNENIERENARNGVRCVVVLHVYSPSTVWLRRKKLIAFTLQIDDEWMIWLNINELPLNAEKSISWKYTPVIHMHNSCTTNEPNKLMQWLSESMKLTTYT